MAGALSSLASSSSVASSSAFAAWGSLGAAVPIEWPIMLGLLLFAVGLYGVTCRRNILLMLLSVEIMLNAANVILVAFSRVHHDLAGQVFVFFAMVVAAAEVAVGLAIVIALWRLTQSTDVDDADVLRETDHGPLPAIRLEGEDAHHDHAHESAHGEAAHHDHAHDHASAHAHGHAHASSAAHGEPEGHGHG